MKPPRWLLRIRLLQKLFAVMRNPEKTELIFDIADTMFLLGAMTETTRRLSVVPQASELIRSRQLLRKFDLKELASKPPGTLGFEFAAHMNRLRLDPDFFRVREIRSDVDFIVMRMRQTHDLWHVVSGFGTDVPGELAVQALMFSYLALPLSTVLLGGALLKLAFVQTEMIGPVVTAISAGVRLGTQTKGLFYFDWDANWNRPLIDVRRELGMLLQETSGVYK